MILTQADVDEFIEAYSDYQCDYDPSVPLITYSPSDRSLARFYRWLADHPQVLVGSCFQEYVGAHRFGLYKKLVRRRVLIPGRRPAFRLYEGQWVVISSIPSDGKDRWDAYSLEALRFELSHSPYDSDALHDKAVVDLIGADEMIRRATTIVKSGLDDPTAFVSPRLWTPLNQGREKEMLQASSVAIIRALQQEKKSLVDVSSRVFEDLVAEVLRSRGMEIHVVRESPQGGRDIIARGELVPGLEPFTIAVEVKHKAVVDRPEVQVALHQNRRFPALLFVTSGRFTAGAVREAKLAEHRMRLFLKDGLAFRELLKAYEL